MHYSMISSMYDGDRRKIVYTKTEVNEEGKVVSSETVETSPSINNEEYVIMETPTPSHRVEVSEGIEYLVTPEGKKFPIWAIIPS